MRAKTKILETAISSENPKNALFSIRWSNNNKSGIRQTVRLARQEALMDIQMYNLIKWFIFYSVGSTESGIFHPFR